MTTNQTNNSKEVAPELAQASSANLEPQLDQQPQPGTNDNDSSLLTQKISELEEKVRTTQDQLLRSLADMENLRNRMQREREDTQKFAISEFARALLSVADNLDRALKSITDNIDDTNPVIKSLHEGVTLTQNELNSVFAKFNLCVLNPLHEKFNPDYHQAIMQQPSSQHEPGTIVAVFQTGYTLNNRLVRPALVAVATAEQ